MDINHGLIEALEHYSTLEEPSRSLYLNDILKGEVEDRIRFINGTPRPLHETKRSRYLASIRQPQFDALRHDIVSELLKRGRSGGYPSIPASEASARTMLEEALSTTVVPGFVNTTGPENFQSLIADFVCELDRRLSDRFTDISDTGSSIESSMLSNSSLRTPSIGSGIGAYDTSDTELSDNRYPEPFEVYDGFQILHPQPVVHHTKKENVHISATRNAQSAPRADQSNPDLQLRLKSPPNFILQYPGTIAEEDEEDADSHGQNDIQQTYPELRRSASDGAILDVEQAPQMHRSSSVGSNPAIDATTLQQMDRTAAILAAPSHVPPIHLTARHSARSSWRMNASLRRASSHRDSSVSSVQSFLSAQASMHGDGINEIASKAQSSEWLTFLDSLALIPEPLDEQNWSGKGQHVEYQRSEESNVPLVEEGILGHSASAIVQSVRCKRIRLARKTISCTRRFKREDAIKEVEHLQRLGHCHIVRVVGSYVIESKLSILLYPATEWSLDTFIDSIYQGIEVSSRKKHLLPFMRCLSETINFIHSRLVKHMDIKPKNLLVKALKSTGTTFNRFKIYVADFGIARSYKSSADAETEGRTSFTKLYAAPEVVDQGPRGFGADIFSLGCVFLEILAAFVDFHGEQHSKGGSSSKHSDKLRSIREANEDFDESYQANTSALQDWLYSLDIVDNTSKLDQDLCSLVSSMIDSDPSKRPSISNIVGSSSLPAGCSSCHVGPEPFEAAD